jgi:hypothetical protein
MSVQYGKLSGMNLNLTPPESKVASATFTSQLIAGIKTKIEQGRKGKEPLTALTFRLPARLQRDLKAGCERHGVSQSTVLVSLLEAVVPMMLTDEKPVVDQSGELQHFVELLRVALPQILNSPRPGQQGTR